jgi:predicted MPP superfamily phosphohydrolase
MKDLPKELSGFSIVQLSDIHLESYKYKKRIAYIIDRVNELKPDLVVITGDLIDGNVCEEEVFCQQLRSIKATHGVLAITGNHEFYAGLDNFMELAKRSNIKVLRNETVTIADTLQIIGLEDDTASQFGLKGPDPDTLIKSCNPDKPIIVLYHRPMYFDQMVEKGVDLQLSGHTHAGQIPPMELIVWLYYKYPFGLFEKDGAYIYTSSGTGIWGPEMRFLSKNEIVHFTLEAK